MEDRECPHKWDNCIDCLYDQDCKAGLHFANPIIEVAATVEKQIDKEVAKSVEIIKGRKLLAEEDFWTWWGKSSPPNLHSKEALPLDGPSAPGGGGSMKCKKSKKGNKPTVYVWGETL